MARNKFDVDENLESPFQLAHLKRAFKYIKKYRWILVLSFVLAIIGSLSSLFVPKISEWVMDDIIPAKDYAGLGSMALLFVGIVLLCIVINVVRSRMMAHVSQNIIYDIRKDLFAHLQRLPFSYYDSRPAGKILVRVINYVNSIADILSNGIINTIIEFINLIAIAIFMFSTDVTLTWVVLAGLPVFIAVILYLKPRQRKAWQTMSNKNSNYNAYLAESIDGVRVSQLFTRQDVNTSIMTKLAVACRTAWMRAIYISNAVWFSSSIITQLVFTFLYLAGCYWIGGGQMVSFGVILAMGQYVSRFWQPITNLANLYNSFVNNIAYLERIFEMMDEPVVVDDCEGATELPAIEGGVTFDDVTFAYVPGTNILENLSFEVKPGESIALVGPTGAGKTTVVNLISRFYNLSGGRVLIDGHDISKVTLHSLRSQMGIMLQDSFIFSGTIADNIRYGRLDAPMEDVRKACRTVCADEFIMEMEKGYDTEVSERGGSLSQGQKQLIAFARTLLSDPKILILDEATSSIDAKTERQLQTALDELMKGRTSFIIAHRLSTIKNCDRIMYISDKGITECGSHDELLAKKGDYYKLYMAQRNAD